MTTESDGTSSELFSALGKDVSQLFREELDRMRTELGDSAREVRTAAALFGGAGVLGALAAGASVAVVVRVLDRWLPRSMAALVAAGLYGAAAAGMARLGLAELRRSRQSLPPV